MTPYCPVTQSWGGGSGRVVAAGGGVPDAVLCESRPAEGRGARRVLRWRPNLSCERSGLQERRRTWSQSATDRNSVDSSTAAPAVRNGTKHRMVPQLQPTHRAANATDRLRDLLTTGSSSLYDSPAAACATGFDEIKSQVPEWTGATATYSGGHCNISLAGGGSGGSLRCTRRPGTWLSHFLCRAP